MGQEQNSQFYNNIYDSVLSYQHHYADSLYYKLWQELSKWIEPDMKIIDLGCGSGQLANLLYDIGIKNYIGIDFSQTAIDMANKINQIKTFQFICADFRTCPIPEGDTYMLSEVLEHVQDDLELLKKIPDNKRIIASVPNFDCSGHVRYFLNENSVSKRYNKIINIEYLYNVNNKFFVFIGKN